MARPQHSSGLLRLIVVSVIGCKMAACDSPGTNALPPISISGSIGDTAQTRDFEAFHQFLIDRGLAVRAGQGFPPPRGSVPDDLPVVKARIEALVQGDPHV